MNFLEKIKSRKLSKTLATIAAGGMLFFGAGNLAEADSDSEFTFRQAYLSMKQDNRVFHQNIVFFGTTFHVDINSSGQILRDASMRMNGNINWEYTNPSNNITRNNTMPFYLTQNGEEMTLYVQRQNKWSKFSLPGVPVGFANALKSNDISTLQENIDLVKDVELFRESDTQQIFNITFDGKKLSDRMQSYSKNQNTAELSSEEVADQQRFFNNLNDALQSTDIKCTWTVNKIKNQTVTAVIDFTDLMRAYAKSVLDDSAAGKIVLSDEDRMLMDTIGYYSEFHYSMTYADANEKLNFNLPSAAQKAAVNNNVFQDLFKDMTTSVKKR